MATAKQVDLLLSLWLKTGKPQEVFTLECGVDPRRTTPKMLSDYAAAKHPFLMSVSTARISEAIKRANADKGWDPKLAPCTDSQLHFIIDLERRVFGRITPSDSMTYAEADARIKYLKARASVDTKASRPVKSSSVSFLKLVAG
jgi:hypothetical protein